MSRSLTVLQIIPNLDTGGAEVGCVDMAKYLLSQGHKPIIVTHQGRLIKPCQELGIEVISLPVDSKSPAKLINNASKIRALIDKKSIDLVHVRSRAPAWSTHLALKNHKTPWLSTYHGTYRQNGKLKNSYNSVMTRGAAIIAPSLFYC